MSGMLRRLIGQAAMDKAAPKALLFRFCNVQSPPHVGVCLSSERMVSYAKSCDQFRVIDNV